MFNVLIKIGNKEHNCAWWIYILIKLCIFAIVSWKVKRRNMGCDLLVETWCSLLDRYQHFRGTVSFFREHGGQQVPLKCCYAPAALHSVTTRLQHNTTQHTYWSHQFSPITTWILITCIVAWTLSDCPDTDQCTQSGAVSKPPECRCCVCVSLVAPGLWCFANCGAFQ